MPSTPIVTGSRTVYTHPTSVVSVAPACREQEFVEVSYLRLDELRMACGPEIDQAHFSYRYGDITQHDETTQDYYPPVDLVGTFVKVYIEDTVYAEAFAEDPDTDEVDESITWYGIIEPEERKSDGSTADPENHASGDQMIVAFGGARLLEKQFAITAHVDVDGTPAAVYEVKRCLPFNSDPGGAYDRLGNRSLNKIAVTQEAAGDLPEMTLESYVFSWEPREAAEWTAFDAVEYLLTHHCPKDADGNRVNQWQIVGDSTLLDWYDISQETDEHSVKLLIDRLIQRRRGVGYFVEFDPALTDPEDVETAQNIWKLKLFTFNDADVTFDDASVLPANPDQYSLDFEHALDVEEAVVGNMATQRYHRIVARGARRTTTFTTRIGSLPVGESMAGWDTTKIIAPGWTQEEEDEYVAGASGAADYATLTTEEKARRNAIARTSDRLREVFRRFVLNPAKSDTTRWTGRIPVAHQAAFADPDLFSYWLRGDITSDPYSALYDSGSDYDGRDHVPSLRIMRALPLYERLDYETTGLDGFDYTSYFSHGTHPSFIPPFAYARTYTGDAEAADITGDQVPHRYELLDRFNHGFIVNESGVVGSSLRDWSTDLWIADTEPAIELRASVPHFIGGVSEADFASWPQTLDEHNPTIRGGIDYEDIWVTLCVELNECIEVSEVLSEPPDNAPLNTLVINAPDCRFDYVTPYTVTEIRDGVPIQTATGGFAKNDLERLQKVARSAAEWYGKDRQTLHLRYKQVRGIFDRGWLITDVGGRYNRAGINTPITAITYRMGQGDQPGTTTIETSYQSLDFTG